MYVHQSSHASASFKAISNQDKLWKAELLFYPPLLFWADYHCFLARYQESSKNKLSFNHFRCSKHVVSGWVIFQLTYFFQWEQMYWFFIQILFRASSPSEFLWQDTLTKSFKIARERLTRLSWVCVRIIQLEECVSLLVKITKFGELFPKFSNNSPKIKEKILGLTYFWDQSTFIKWIKHIIQSIMNPVQRIQKFSRLCLWPFLPLNQLFIPWHPLLQLIVL